MASACCSVLLNCEFQSSNHGGTDALFAPVWVIKAVLVAHTAHLYHAAMPVSAEVLGPVPSINLINSCLCLRRPDLSC